MILDRYTFKPGETEDEWRARLNQVEVDTEQFTAMLKKVRELAEEVNNSASQRGFETAWLKIMFSGLELTDRKYVLEVLENRDQKLLMKKIAHDPG